MKKYLFVLLGLSFLFFSCASKPEADIPEIDSVPVQETTEPEETTETEENNEITDTPSEEISTAETAEEEDDVEIVDTEVFDEEAYLAELEELSNPEVTDVEYVEEPEVTLQEKTDLEETEESVPQGEAETTTEAADESTNAENNAEELNTSLPATNQDEATQNSEQQNNQQDEDEIIDLTITESPEDIIEILDDSSDSTPEEVEPVIIIPSRKVTLKIGQTLEVMYPGSGWIYMGTTDNTKDFAFLGKKLGTQNTKFTFTAKAEGSKILHFYKNDALTEKYLDDYLEVEITKDKDSTKATVSAPAYKQPVPVSPKEKKVTPIKEEVKTEVAPAAKETPAPVAETKKAEPVTPAATKTNAAPAKPVEQPKTEEKTEVSKPETTVPVISEKEVQDLLKQAHTLFENKEYKNALNTLNQFFEYGTKNRDEALYLQGQIYEATGSTKNIKLAIEAYKNITTNYPASPYWDLANKRIIYLTKFYLEGR